MTTETSTQTIELLPVGVADVPFLYRLLVDRGHQWFRVAEERLPNPHEFETLLWKDCVAGFVVLSGTQKVGFASIFDLRPRDAAAWVEVEAFDGVPTQIVDGTREYLAQYGIEAFGLRKLYHASSNPDLAASSGTTSWVLEGTLREYDLMDGQHIDRHLYATTVAR